MLLSLHLPSSSMAHSMHIFVLAINIVLLAWEFHLPPTLLLPEYAAFLLPVFVLEACLPPALLLPEHEHCNLSTEIIASLNFAYSFTFCTFTFSFSFSPEA